MIPRPLLSAFLPAPSKLPLLACALGLTLGLSGCRAPTQAPIPSEPAPSYGDAWFTLRAASLKISPQEAMARDSAMGDAIPSAQAWDETLSAESAAIWASSCASCHGMKGDPAGASISHTPPPRLWGTFGTRMGFTMGGDDMRKGVFETIRDGAPPHEDGSESAMLGWGDRLSNEQMWGLVWHIEGF